MYVWVGACVMAARGTELSGLVASTLHAEHSPSSPTRVTTDKNKKESSVCLSDACIQTVWLRDFQTPLGFI